MDTMAINTGLETLHRIVHFYRTAAHATRVPAIGQLLRYRLQNPWHVGTEGLFGDRGSRGQHCYQQNPSQHGNLQNSRWTVQITGPKIDKHGAPLVNQRILSLVFDKLQSMSKSSIWLIEKNRSAPTQGKHFWRK
jgi:hypothetical protein